MCVCFLAFLSDDIVSVNGLANVRNWEPPLTPSFFLHSVLGRVNFAEIGLVREHLHVCLKRPHVCLKFYFDVYFFKVLTRKPAPPSRQ